MTKPPLDQIATKKIIVDPSKASIIFLHDSLGCISLWRDFPEKLSQQTACNVLIYDRQGYGDSCGFSYQKRDNSYMEQEADILIDLLEYWDIQNPILFGHSDGGSIALIAAGKYPDKIAGVVTEGAHIFVEEITVAGIKEAMDLYRDTNLKSKLEKYHGDKTEALFYAWAHTWTTDTFWHWNIEGFLPTIQCPLLIIQGEDDEYGSLKQVERIVEQSGGEAASLIIPKVKHTPHKEVPELILNESSRFIKELME